MSEFDLKHALSVAGRVDDLHAKLAALLHDAIEDGAAELDDLRDADLPESVIEAVKIVTHRRDESYDEYIERIRESKNDLAIYVKLADLEANLARMDDEHASLTDRYRRASRDLRELA